MTFKLKLNTKIILIILLIFSSFLRSPYIFLKGRFMAEDGELFFKSAYENNFFEHLTFFASNSGYYNFIANLLSEISTHFSIYQAPLIVAYGSLFFIILPVILILFKNSYLFKNDFHKIIASLLFFFSTPNSPEIWANSINSQIYLFLSIFLILYFKNEKDQIKLNEKILILIAGLSGIYSCILTPLFFFKFYYLKKKNDFINFIILFLCTIVQILLILYSKINNLLYTSNIELVEKPIFYINNFIYSFFIKPIFGRDLLYFIDNLFLDISLKNYLSIISVILITISSFILIKVNLLSFIKKDKIFQSLIILYFLIIFVITIGSDSFPPSGRYAAIPGILFLIIIFYVSIFFNVKSVRYFFTCIIMISLVSGIYEFRPNSKYIKFLDCINCPDWKDQVIKWEINKDSSFKIWPYHRKGFKLSEKNEIK